MGQEGVARGAEAGGLRGADLEIPLVGDEEGPERSGGRGQGHTPCLIRGEGCIGSVTACKILMSVGRAEAEADSDLHVTPPTFSPQPTLGTAREGGEGKADPQGGGTQAGAVFLGPTGIERRALQIGAGGEGGAAPLHPPNMRPGSHRFGALLRSPGLPTIWTQRPWLSHKRGKKEGGPPFKRRGVGWVIKWLKRGVARLDFHSAAVAHYSTLFGEVRHLVP